MSPVRDIDDLTPIAGMVRNIHSFINMRSVTSPIHFMTLSSASIKNLMPFDGVYFALIFFHIAIKNFNELLMCVSKNGVLNVF